MESPSRLPLRRPERGRVVGGVAAGVALHLGLSVRLVRVLFVLLTPVGGIGAGLYVFWWVTIPVGDPAAAADADRPAELSRLHRPLQSETVHRLRRLPWTEIAVGVALLAGAAAMLLARAGTDVVGNWVVPALLLVAGATLAWSQLDAVQRGRKSGRGPVSVLRLVGGLVIAFAKEILSAIGAV